LSVTVESLGAEVIYSYTGTITGFAFKAPNQEVTDLILNTLALIPQVRYVEQDRTTVPFETIPTGIERVDADPLFRDTGIDHINIDTDIAIIDSGIDLDHPDLNVYRNITSIISESSQDDNLLDGVIDLKKLGLDLTNNTETRLYPPFSKNSTSFADDNCGHGTHVAGVAAAKHDSFGVTGIAPGARLWAIKVLEYNEDTHMCEGSISSLIRAIDYVTNNANEIEVVNLSLGCKCEFKALAEALDRSIAKNMTYVVAAGNSHADASTFSPANHDDVITVSAIADDDGKCGSTGIPLWIEAGNMSGYTVDDSFASFSNYGSVIDIAAPGVSINSTYNNGSYVLMGGTSIAAPHVTGAIALYKLLDPDSDVEEVRNALTSTGSTRNTVCDGQGRGYFTQDLDNSFEPLLHISNIVESTRDFLRENSTFAVTEAARPDSDTTAFTGADNCEAIGGGRFGQDGPCLPRGSLQVFNETAG
jgi:subtilisin family serine protease